MNCFKKKNKIYPERLNSISEINTDINLNFNNKNELYCNGCRKYSDDLDKFIICGGCNKFYCCKIAGECIGKNCFISHGVMFINDTFKKGKVEKNPNKFKKTTIGNNVIIGSNSTILPVKISNGVVIGAGSVVTKNINVKGIYAGNPAMLIRKL